MFIPVVASVAVAVFLALKKALYPPSFDKTFTHIDIETSSKVVNVLGAIIILSSTPSKFKTPKLVF